MKNLSIGALALALAAAPGAADAESARAVAAPAARFPPAGCRIAQQDGIVAGAAKAQKLHVALGQCGESWNAWLFLKEGGKATLLDTLALPTPGAEESFNLAGGACARDKKPVMENIVLHANWNGHASIRAGDGLIRIWTPDARQRRFVETPLAGVRCRRDEP